MRITSKIILCGTITLSIFFNLSCKGKTSSATGELDLEKTDDEPLAEETEDTPTQEIPDNFLYTTLFGNSGTPLGQDFDGLEELGFGLYDARTGIYHSIIEENGPYIQKLASLNELFKNNQLASPEQDQNPQTVTFSYQSKSLNEAAELIAPVLKTDSWEAIQATSTDKFKQAIKKMQIDAKTYGIDELDAYYVKEASLKKAGKK